MRLVETECAILSDKTPLSDPERYNASRNKHNLKTGSGTSRRFLPYVRIRAFDGGFAPNPHSAQGSHSSTVTYYPAAVDWPTALPHLMRGFLWLDECPLFAR
jgi:hypothetical protein